jgi:hypothetical protein
VGPGRSGGRGPVPTVEVVAQLAFALRLDPIKLLERVLRLPTQHVLVLAHEPAEPIVRYLEKEAGGTVNRWLVSGSAVGLDVSKSTSKQTQPLEFRLRRVASTTYSPDEVAHALLRELTPLAPGVGCDAVGVVFAEITETLSQLDHPLALVEFEKDWAGVVDDVSEQVGLATAWNVCVYSADAIRNQANPAAVAAFLVGSHDRVVVVDRDRMIRGPQIRRTMERWFGLAA